MTNDLKIVLLGSEENIDDYIFNLINVISTLKTELDMITNWHDNEWMNIIKENNYKEYSNKWNDYEIWIYKYIYDPKRYEFCVYLRAFLNTLKIYLKENHRDHINYKSIWDSSKYLKYLIHLIFKTGLYKVENDKKEWECITIENDNEIIEELDSLISFVSKPLHGFSIYYNTNKKLKIENNSNNYLNKKIYSISNLILEKSIFNENVTKYEIDPKKNGNDQEYIKWTSPITTKYSDIENFLKFIESNCLQEFEKYIESKTKSKDTNI